MVKVDVKASKALSWLLRHGAEKEGLVIHSGGWISLDDVLRKPNFKKFTVDQVKGLVGNCPKQRFALKEEQGLLYIRANQGHSIQIDDSDLEEITSESIIPIVVHGTYYRHWNNIKLQGLSRMNRRHIHLAPGLPGEDGVISGMRSSCEIYIYIDLTKALAGDLAITENQKVGLKMIMKEMLNKNTQDNLELYSKLSKFSDEVSENLQEVIHLG